MATNASERQGSIETDEQTTVWQYGSRVAARAGATDKGDQPRCDHCGSQDLSRVTAVHKHPVIGPEFHKWQWICRECHSVTEHAHLEGNR